MAKKYKLDNIDKKILDILSRDGKKSNIELSREVGISPSPCLRRVKILEETQVIKSYSIDVDFTFLDYNLLFFASLSTSFNNTGDQKVFQQQLLSIPEILEVYLLNNDTDYLIKIIVKNYLDYKILVNTKLSRIHFIKNIRITKINKTLKKSSFISI